MQSRISNGTLIIIPPPFEANLPMRCLTSANTVITQHFQRWMFLHQAYYGLYGKTMQTSHRRTPKTSSDAALQLSSSCPPGDQKQKAWRSHWDGCQGWWARRYWGEGAVFLLSWTAEVCTTNWCLGAADGGWLAL